MFLLICSLVGFSVEVEGSKTQKIVTNFERGTHETLLIRFRG